MKPLNLLPKLLRSSRVRFVVLVATLLSLLTVMSTGFAVDITGISAQWRTPPSGSSGDPTCYTIDNTAPLVEVRYGDNDAVTTDCPSSSAAQSGFGFTNGNTGTYTNGTPFILGELTHYNNQVFASSLLTSAYLDFDFTSTAPALPAFETLISLDETANNLQTCPYGDSAPCADRVSLLPAALRFTESGTEYQLETLGFIPGTLGTCTYNAGALRQSYISDEDADNSVCLFARVSPVSESEMQISKSTEATSLAPGDIVDYQIDYTCASTTSTCNNVQIVDFLPSELVYLSSTGSIHTVATTGSYSAAGNNVLFDFIDPLPAGSTGFVRIRVRVRDDGTLANAQQITNLASSTLSNGPTSNTSSTLSVTTTSTWDVRKSALTSAYISTEPPLTDMTYNVQICPAGSNVNLLNAQMVDTLPAGSVYVSSTGGGSYNSTNHTVTWAMGELAASAGCASRQVTIRFPNPPFTSGNSVLNTVTGTGTITGGAAFSDTADLPSTLGNFIPVPSVLIDKGTTRTDYVIGASVDYFLTPTNSGNTYLYNLRMIDDLPDQIRVTQVRTGASSYPITLEYALNGSVGYVTWTGSPFTSNTTLNVADLGLDPTDWITSLRWTFNPGSGTPPGWTLTEPAVIRGTITSPDRLDNPILEPSEITNTAYLSWEYLPGGLGDCSNPDAICGIDDDGATIEVVTVPVPVYTKSSAGGVGDNQRFIIGQDVGYYTLAVDNNTGIAVNNLTITDDIPVQFNVTSVNVGTYVNYTDGLVGVSYATNGGLLVAWPGSPFAQGTTLSVASLALLPNTYISQLQFSYDQVTDDAEIPLPPPTVSGGFSGSVRINGTTLATDRNGDPVNENDTMANASRIDWDFMGLPNSRTSDVANPIHQPTAQLSASKTTTSTGPYIPTSAVSFRLSFGASGSSPSNIINAPVVADLLPLNVNYVSYTFNANSTALNAPTFTSIPDFQGTGRTLLRWTFTGTMNRGQTAYIDLNTTLAAGTPNGSIQNTFGVSVNDMPMVNGTPDTQDWDGDTQTNDLIVTTNTSVFVDQLVGLDSQKRVRGELDSEYSVFPNYGRTVPNGDVDYRLTIINRGNISVRNVRVIDILPFVGDTGVQDTRPRQSAWRPILTSLIAPQSGVTIYYSTATNPCRPEIIPSGPVGCTAANWTLTPANLDAVRSVRFDFSGTLSPGQSFTFDWEMRAPNTALPPNNSIAWNSFAFTSTNATTGVPLRPAEPNKVGIRLVTDTPTALIDLEKYTSSVAAPTPLFDADLAPGPQISMIDTPLWTYVITNTGATRLGSIVLTDTPEGAVTSCTPALTPSTILEIGDSMTCTLTAASTAQQGQYANSATVTSVAVDGSGDPIDGDPVTPGVQEIHPQDTDPSHYYGYDPALSRLGDYTWIDLNADGIQDVGEPALGGITVHLLDAAGDPVDDPSQAGVQPYTTITDADGFYTFNNLLAGTYRVRFEIPSAYSLTTPDTGSAPLPDENDSDADTTTGITGTYTLAVAEYNRTADAGFIARAALGDRVWMDSNGNGIQDTGEPGYNLADPMQVELLDGSNNVLATTTLDVDGMYFFDDLQPGVPYRVRFPAPPAGYVWTTRNASGSTTANDSNVSVASPYTTAVITLDAGEYDPDWDAGLVTVAAIGNYVWNDADADGIQDSGETGVAGVTVRLLQESTITPGTYVQATRDDGTLIADVVTTSSGAYSFTNLRPGEYRVSFVLPSGYIFTDPDQGGNSSTDSDAYVSPSDITYAQTVVTTLEPGETDNTWDAGVIALASLGNFVWQDTNNNGQQDSGEPGVAGVIVTLLDSFGNLITEDALENPINPITTDSTGAYSFTNLDPRIDYIVEFERPTNYVFATPNTGNDATDSDAAPSPSLPLGIGHTGVIDLAAGENNETIDAGLVQVASLGNFVWYDTDNDGQQDLGEGGAQNVTVRLLNSSGTQATDERGTLIPDLLTDVDGEYVFTNLRPGTYSLAFSTLPTTYTFARRNLGATATDSDPDRFTGHTITTTLDPNENDLTWDAGLVVAAALGDLVWEDIDGDGQQDGGLEVGIAGVTVRLLNGSNDPIDNPNTLGTVDNYEAITDSNGNYAFVGLPPNETYRVRFVRPTGYIWTRPNTGADATDSDGTSTNVTSGTTTSGNITTLTPGATDNTWDQGVLLPSALGNIVWRDNDDDGIQTNLNGVGGEPGIGGVTVNLLDSSGNPVDDPNQSGVQNYTITTASSGTVGSYAFINLYPGQYIVEFVTPSGYKRADYMASGSTTADDSDGQIANGRTATITLPYDTTDNTWDAGFVPLAALGNFVWLDLDNDGIQDGGLEVGVAGATVTLLDAATGNPVLLDGMGNSISPVVTTSSGAYSFTNLDPDLDYVVEFTLPTAPAGQSGYKFSPQDVVGTEATDSDADTSTGRTATIPLAPGETNNDIDAGLTPLSSLGNYVWVDTDGDGVQDGGEAGINNVTVRLLTSGGVPVDDPNQVGTQDYVVTTVTNGGADGYYQFINLDAGSYIVEFTLPTGYIFTRQDSASATDATDSDADRFTGRTGTYTLGWNDSNQTIDAGIVLPASLGDFVWYDADDDGVQDAVAAEAGVNGVVVRLLDSSNNPVDNPNTSAVNDAYVIITADHPTTFESGFYLFEGLLPGDYRVHFDLPASTLTEPSANYVIARQNQGADDAADSDPDRDTGITATISLSAGEDDLTNDAGILLRGARLGNRVWIDLNNNGVQDVGEVGLNGVTVTLLNGSGGTDIDPITPGTQTLSTTTANDAVIGDGYYQFTGLVPGTYIVEVTLPAGYQFSPQDAGSPNDDTTDSDVDLTTGRTAVITINESGDDQTWDAGVVPLASIGNYTFIDQNNDGIQDNDPQDGPLSGVTVRLLDTSGNPVDDPNQAGTQDYVLATDVNGAYRFTNLPPDVSYIVQFDLPAGYRRSPVDAGSDDTLDSDASLTDGRSPATYLSPDEYDDTVDAGFVPLARLGDYVWVDTDGDGVQGVTEVGLNGVTVRLLDSSGDPVDDPTQVGTQDYVVTTVTNAGLDGYYQFIDLDAGDYIVEFVLPTGYVFTTQNSASATDATDSDADRFTGRTGTYTLDWGDSDQSVDAGMVLPSALGDYVWRDDDNDGVQDGGEPGVSGVVVNLLDGSGNPVDNPNTSIVGDAYTTTTDSNGEYSFTGLIPGTYIVEFVLPTPPAGTSGYKFSPQDVGADTSDSDASTTTGRTTVITLPINTTDNTWDAGLTPLSTLGDFVWIDADGNGVQEPDPSEPGLNGVTVRLLDSAGDPVDDPNQVGTQNYEVTTVNHPTTGEPGYYQFINLDAGDYIVEVVLPTGYIFTRPDVGADTGDSDVDRFTGQTGTYTLDWGDTDQTADAGVLLPAALGNYVWLDADDDGVQDVGELGINGVTVRLLNAAGDDAVVDPNSPTVQPYIVTTSTVGGVAGSYSFVNLFPGTYTVQFDLPDGDHVFARLDVGADDEVDSDADRTTGITGTYTLVAGQTDNSVDAGMMTRASIGDRVWIDINNNGVQDAGEVGLNGVTVNLLDSTGTQVATTTTVNHPTTTAPGYYVFEDLVPGVYSLHFDLPAGYQRSAQDAGSPNDDAFDSDPDFTTGDTVTTHLLSGEDDMTWDSGLVPLVSIGDRVWIDIDNDGVQDVGEANFPGVTVNLLNSSGTVIDTTTTDGDGEYLFDLLPPGVYAIEFVLPYGYQFSQPDLGGSDAEDSDANTTTGRTINVTLLPGVDDMTWDAGMVPLTSIGDRVWVDIDNNGVQDVGEVGYEGATVNLLNSSGSVIDTTTTDTNGEYLFDLLPPGVYAIEVVLPSGYQFSPQDSASATDETDSDVDFTTGRTVNTTLLPDEDDMTWDAGLVPLTSIGNFVWRDRDGDGVQEAGEPGISGIVINLLNSSGVVIASTTTDANGFYSFEGLPPADYAIQIASVPPAYIISPLNQGSDSALDSDVDPVTGRSVNTTLIPNEHDMTWDIGLSPLPSIGDRVWYDNDGDGIQDVGEPGAPNITVRLLDSTGTPIASTTTDANGDYLFENLLPGSYSIEFVLPGGYSFSPQDAGADDALDSDVDPVTGRTEPTTLAFDEVDRTWDAGLIALGSIGDFVWNDLDADGVQDPGEPGIPGVVVILTYPNGTTVSTTTDGSGKYLFVDLPAGVYTIRVDENTLPPGYGQTYDLNGELDHMATYTLAINEDAVTVDFGYVELGSIGDTIWVDTNRNGRVDGNERGIPNVTVTLVLPDGTTRTTVTDADGKYLFEDLYPGEYIVIVDVSTLPRGLQQVFDPDGTRDSRTVVVLGAGEHHLTADFGYAPPAAATNPPPSVPPPAPADWQPVPSCQRDCVDWQLYHTNQTGDWEIFRLGNLGDRPSVSPNLSQGEGFDDMSPTRSPNAEWIVFTSNRDGNWELYVAPTDGDSSKTRRLTYNTVAIDTDPVWGPNNFVVYETTRDGNWELYMLDMVTGAERRLTDNPGSDINAFWSNDGAKILFQSDRSGIWQIYQLDLRTNAVTLLSDGTANDVDPQYSSDDNRIAFRSYRDDAEKSAIYLMDADGDNLLRVSDVNGDATNQSWSPNDRLIAYQSDLDGDLDIYIYDVASRTTRQLTDNDVDDYAPTWNCDTLTVIFTSDAGGNPDIYDADALPITAPAIDVTKAANQLTIDPADDIYPEAAPVEENASREGRLPGMTLGEQTAFLLPDTSTTVVDPSLERAEAWQPVNSCPQVCPAWTLYQTDRTGDVEIFRLGVDGARDINLSVGIEATDRGPTRAPNARWIAFTSDRDGNEEIYIASADGLAAQRRVTYNAATDTDPAWSPDSQRIVYESDRDGNWNLYVLDVQTGVETQITTDAANDTNGDWSSAGDSIVFQSDRDGRSQLYVYHLGTGETTRLVNIPQAATAPVYANGGSMIAFRVRETGGNTVIYVVQQDGTGLQAISDPDGGASSPEWYFDDTLLAYQSDLDGDLDIYVYDFATNTTRKLTDNTVADFAPTWICGEPDVIFTSEVTGNDDLFLAPALPIDDPAIDVQASAEQLTSSPASDRFPVGAPNEEDGSRND